MELTLTNGTPETLRDLRVQMCVMLKGAAGFTAQTHANKVFQKPYVACHSDDGAQWILSAVPASLFLHHFPGEVSGRLC